jgi:hypothetical protein
MVLFSLDPPNISVQTTLGRVLLFFYAHIGIVLAGEGARIALLTKKG